LQDAKHANVKISSQRISFNASTRYNPAVLDLLILPPWGWLYAGLWGALWGSFFNVAIHRVGLYESVVRPPSRCPSCGKDIAFYDNIPIVSWLILGGRCRRCRSPISIRYPLVEGLSTLLALGVYWRFVATGQDEPMTLLARFFVYFSFCGTLLVLSGIDFDHLLLPDRITLPSVPIFLLCGILLRDVPPLDLIVGAVVGYGGILLLVELTAYLLKREGMGMGDAKLLMLVGALLGWKGVLWTFFLAPFVALPIVLPVRILQRQKVFQVEIPYGPFLAIAAVGYLFFGQLLVGLLFPA
jgi:leader peptidase (prepilin peptidase)/N-methyltransferase